MCANQRGGDSLLETFCKIISTNSPNLLTLSVPTASFYLVEEYGIKEKDRILVGHFKRRMNPRSTGKDSQNHAINGGCQQIAEFTGHSFEEMKSYCKRRALRRGYPVKKDSKGKPLISPITGNPIPESEAQIDTRQAGFLIDEIIHLAAELGLILRGFVYD